MCIGAIKKPFDCLVPIIGGGINYDFDTFYPEHRFGPQRSSHTSSLALTFFAILILFYAAFKVLSSMYELKESVLIFLIAFAFGFFSAKKHI